MARPMKRRDGGASLVEFALLLPVFAMLLFGGITAGLALNEKQQMTHATREGARYAAAVAPDQEFAGRTWAEAVRELIVERSTGSLVEGDVCVSLVIGSEGGLEVVSPDTEYSTDDDNDPCIQGQEYIVTAVDEGLRVQVTARKPAKIDLVLFGSYEVTLESEATARSEGDL
ncbi:pilus assembly protein [Acidimicrobiia bacterium EGI L10123]|uniref:TadE/TadG family type IV pilus assembly protein n=1 Tax=Salinilacustrithrix flava TaxID=2957203 RepID=UPI003D7C14C0|nr:pilus assembly protein [Acidimicrobiia bacterium EGI L10123]